MNFFNLWALRAIQGGIVVGNFVEVSGLQKKGQNVRFGFVEQCAMPQNRE